MGAFPTNLPLQLTSFIGRDREIGAIKRLLSKKPLLTVTGSGGASKTRLAIEVAADLLSDFPDGVWLVELAAARVKTFGVEQIAARLDERLPLNRRRSHRTAATKDTARHR